MVFGEFQGGYEVKIVGIELEMVVLHSSSPADLVQTSWTRRFICAARPDNPIFVLAVRPHFHAYSNTIMSSMSTEERVQAVSQFLLQSPPGEINDVLNGPFIAFVRYQDHVADAPPICVDVRMLVGDDESLEAGVLPALQQYNLEQFTVAEVPDAGHTVSTAHSGLTFRTHPRLLRDVRSLL